MREAAERSAGIMRQQIQKPSRTRSKPADAKIAIQKHDPDVRRQKQILEVRGHLSQLFNLMLILRVDRVKFFIDRVQFLIGALQFFIRCDKFFIRRLQFFVAGFLLFNQSLQVFASMPQFQFQRLQLIA